MEITGRIIAVLPLQSGMSQRTGQQWASQQFVLQTDERFPQKFLFKVFGQDRIQQWNIQMGQVITVQFGVDAHETNGRWYGENTAYNVFGVQQMQPAAQPQYQQPAPQPAPQPHYQQPAPQPQQPQQSPFPPQGGQTQYQPAPQGAQPAAQQGGLPFPPGQ